LAAAVSWGAGDFGGGVMTRRTPVLGVVLISQIVGVVIAVVLMVAQQETAPSGPDIGWAVVGGFLGGVGITSLYRGLALGRMGIVAPVTGVLAALIPVGAGFILEGPPSQLVLIGIVVALIAVILVSRVADEGGGREGLGLALLAGTTIGAFGVVIAQFSEGHVFGPLAVVRGTESILLAALVLATRSAWRPARRHVPVLSLIGVADMAGNTFYLLAIQAGALAIASVVSSLYPVITVLLAAILLRERVTATHAVGIVLAATAIVLIGIGSA
jgi:drug/metabolite transporter (DMT)-like permease